VFAEHCKRSTDTTTSSTSFSKGACRRQNSVPERSDGIGEHVGIDVMFGRDISYHLVEELVDGLVYFFHGV
jgi:hypothetical protein